MTQPAHTEHSPRPRRASLLQIAKAVFWSFLGIRRRSAHDRDTVSLTLPQVVVAGIIGAVIFVLSLVMLARFITN